MALEQLVVRVQARGDGEADSGEPGAVAFAEETGCEGRFLDGGCVELDKIVSHSWFPSLILTAELVIRTTQALSQSMYKA